jgi:hypothetical protein
VRKLLIVARAPTGYMLELSGHIPPSVFRDKYDSSFLGSDSFLPVTIHNAT